MAAYRKPVLGAALGLYAVWAARNLARIMDDDNGFILFCLGTLFAALTLLRPKPPETVGRPASTRLGWFGALGALAVIIGLIVPVRQFEWLGLLAILYACLRWALPPAHAVDVRWALLLLYWAHPLPSVVTGGTQHTLQWLSVAGSEWALHCLNVRVWADGFILRTGYGAFGVDEVCSGLRAASTVFISVLGVGVLLRFRWWASLAFLALGVVQVVLLNIARIGFMVVWAPRMPPEWSQGFLHDSLGIFLLLAVFLIQVEATWWNAAYARRLRLRAGIRRGELDAPEKATILPVMWRRVVKWVWPVVAAAAALAAVAGVFYKHRPSHRAAMYADVIDVLAETEPEAAERAVQAALRLSPGDQKLLEQLGGILVQRGKFKEALKVFSGLESMSVPACVLKSWALMALGRAEEAVAVVEALPPAARQLPAVAMVMAEYAAVRNDTARVSAELRKTGKSHFFTARVRNLFPFLAAHEQWETIVAVDRAEDYATVDTALIAIYACTQMNDLGAAGNVMRLASRRWPEDPRFLAYLFRLALDRPGVEWEVPLERNFVHNLRGLQIDQLANYLADAFRLGRPDLAWMAFARLRELDPRDPALSLAIAEFGGDWFAFRKHDLAMEAQNRTTTVDVLPLYRLSRHMHLFRPFWDRVPAADEVAQAESGQIRRKYLDACLAELKSREESGLMTERLDLMYPGVLASADRYAEAHQRLAVVDKKYPARKAQTALQAAFFWHAQGRWQEAYEALQASAAKSAGPNIQTGILKVNTLMNLGLGLYAFDEVAALRLRFPEAVQLDRAESAIWDVFGFKEEALFALARKGLDLLSRTTVQLLYDTGRVKYAEQMSTVHGVRFEGLRRAAGQPYMLPRAELAIARLWPQPLTPEQMDVEVPVCAARAAEAVSPFLRDLDRMKADWYRAHGAAAASDLARWQAAGRNPAEQVTALKDCAMLLARQQRYEEALAACRRALELSPRSAILWRCAIALRNGKRDTVDEARRACPDDSEIWMADLVTRGIETNAVPAGTAAWLQTAVSGNRLSPGALVRAGEYLVRKRHPELAAPLAKAASSTGMGLVAADALGLECALAMGDTKWAMASALAGIEHAEDPTPFYRVMVNIKARQGITDTDMLRALEYLRKQYPTDNKWGEWLARAYFEKGDMRRSLSLFTEVLPDNLKDVRVKSLLMAAESARLQGAAAMALNVLNSAHALYPAKVNVLNNLIYTLAQDPATLPRARQLLPKLLETPDPGFAVLDTVATVYLRSGEIDKANAYIQKALAVLKPGQYGVLETRLSAAEIYFKLGRFEEARGQLKIIQSAPDVPALVDVGARDLLQRLKNQK